MRRTLYFLSAAVLVVPAVIYAPISSAVAPGACVNLGGFEIDGNMTPNTPVCSPLGDDWTNVNPSHTNVFGTYSTAFKDNSDPSNWTSSGSTPCKSQLTQAYGFTRVSGSPGHFFAYAAVERCDVTGTGGFAIEIDKAPTRVAPDGTPRPDRSQGGAVFFIDFQGASAPTLGDACLFSSQATYPSADNSPGCSTGTNGYEAAVNNAPLNDPIAGVTGIPAGGFAEFGLDVTLLTGLVPGCPAPAAASMYLRTYTGFSGLGPGSNLKGYAKPFDVAPPSTCVPPTITTTATPGNGTIDGLPVVAPGSAQHDVATVNRSGGAGIGTVQFTLCAPAQVVTNGGDCSSGGTAVGSPVTLDGSGNATSSTVTGITTPNDNAAGKYCWRADFTPSPADHHYTAGTHTNSTTECFTVAHASPTVTTVSSAVTSGGAAANSVGFTTLGDVATLSNVVSGADLSSQHVTFTLYGPAGALPTSGTSCIAAGIASGPVDEPLVNVDATTWKATAPTFKPTSAMGAGYYTWVASYAGDTINSAANGTCTDANETAHLVGPNVSLTKGTPHATIVAGDQVVYDVNIDNTGAGTAANVVVTDILPVLPSGHTWSLTPTAGYNCTLGTAAGHQVVTCNVGNLNPIALTQIAEVTATTGPLDCPSISNSATLSADPSTLVTAGPVIVTVQCPHLSIAKTADAASVNVGSNIGFHVTVTNDGLGAASGVLLSDPLPTGPGITWAIDSATGPLSCGIAASVLTCTGTLGQGAVETVHVVSPTSWTKVGEVITNSCLGGTDGSGVYDNTATATATNVIGSVQASASTQVLCPNLHITKSADAPMVNAGTNIGFVVTVSNNGAGDATNVNVSDPLPSGTGITWSVATATGPLSCGISAGTLTCTGTLPAGTVETVHITSPTEFASCATYNNTAQVTAGNDPQAPSASASTTVDCASLVINKTSDAPSVSVGSDIGFTVTVHNTGTGTANGVVISDPLPGGPGVSWSILTQTGPLSCSITGSAPTQSLGCTGTMAPGDLETVHITSHTEFVKNGDVTINSCLGGDGNGTYNNTASETWTNGPVGPISSNQASETVLCPSLTLTKTPDAASVSAGSQIGFTVTVGNGGPGTATNAMISDPLPAGNGVSWSIDAGGTTATGCTITGTAPTQTLNCALGDLAPETNVHVHIVSATTGDSCGTYNNTATLQVGNAPGLTANASTAVNCPAPTLTKTSDMTTVSAGDQIGFTITLSNGSAAGTGTLTGAAINDPLPGGSGVSWSMDSGPDNCSVTGSAPTQTLVCTPVDLAPGASETVHVISGTAFASCAQYTNTATATATNHADLTQTASTTVLCPSLSITKTADAAIVDAGSTIGFTITATNADTEGTGTARGVVINDPLPGGPGVNWSIASGPENCSITGTAPTQTLVCTATTLEPGASETVHVTSPTEFASCADYPNVATLTATNAPMKQASATTTVQCPALAITKTADTAAVASGSQIGFTVEAKNTGAGTAVAATINDPLPAGTGVSWSIDATKTTATGCVITGAVGSQVLACALGDLASGADVKVHVVSATTTASCKVYDNTATLSAGNAPAGSASATTNVICALPTSISRSKTPLAVTGAGPIGPELGWALALIVSGGLALLASSMRPRPRRSH